MIRKTVLFLLTMLGVGLASITVETPHDPVVMRYNEHQGMKRLYGRAVEGGMNLHAAVRAVVLACARACTAVVNWPLRWGSDTKLALQGGFVALAPEVRKKKKAHDQLATEALAMQEKYKGEEMPRGVGEEYEAKIKEAEDIWSGEEGIQEAVESWEAEVARDGRAEKLNRRRLRLQALDDLIPDPTLPPTDANVEGKIVGYATLGDYLIASESYKLAESGNFRTPVQASEIMAHLAAARKTRGWIGADGSPLVPLNHEEAARITAFFEDKAVPTIGAGVIEPQRLDIIPQVTADDRLRLRDVLTVGQTTGNAVSYIREESFTRAAAETAAGNLKPEATIDYTEQTANVRNIPVWIPVTTDQLADWPQLRMLLNNRLLYDIAKREEEQVMYGDGTGQNLEGLLVVSGTVDISASSLYAAGDSTLEKMRVGLTEVRVNGYEPNTVVVHPFDWHETVVAKGTDDHFLGQVFLNDDRAMRVWGAQVVESVALEATAGHATEARNFLVGDFMRGAALLDRMRASVQIGLNDDDFTKNKRTLLAEERVAFPIYAPAAFAKLETVALTS